MKVTTQLTSKPLKLCLIATWIGVVIGIMATFSGHIGEGVMTMALSYILNLVVRGSIWFNHA